jgi:putative membrane protein
MMPLPLLTRYPLSLLLVVMLVALWSFISPYGRFTWVLESFPVFIAAPLLIYTHKKFCLTNLAYTLIALHAMILLIGGHYTYAEMPLFNWLRDSFDLSRNYYDRLGHLVQGFVPAIIIRELLLRTSPLRSGKWVFVIIVFSCLGISALYELLEWAVSELTGEAAEAFLGTQGDVWDTQKDMFCAGIGAVCALVFLSRRHDKELARFLQ